MSVSFRMLLLAREKLYQAGILVTRRLKHPVISIGNLTVGGTGKTPLVIALADRLRRDGFRPVVLSRGYKRSGAGVVIVSRGDGPLVDYTTSGDEPFLMARRTRGVAVVVGADRHDAGLAAERENLGDLFVLDDGFQHRKLYRSVDLVTIDPREWEKGERLLPAGRWREPKSALVRAHAACVQQFAADLTDVPMPSLPIPSFAVQTIVDGVYEGDRLIPVESIRGQQLTAFAGIAKPERFFAALESLGLSPTRYQTFRDHHDYSSRDLENLGNGPLITTEKDAVRLEGRGMRGFMHLRISVKIPEFDRLMELIRSRLSN